MTNIAIYQFRNDDKDEPYRDIFCVMRDEGHFWTRKYRKLKSKEVFFGPTGCNGEEYHKQYELGSFKFEVYQ